MIATTRRCAALLAAALLVCCLGACGRGMPRERGQSTWVSAVWASK